MPVKTKTVTNASGQPFHESVDTASRQDTGHFGEAATRWMEHGTKPAKGAITPTTPTETKKK